jgi:hypothetical protein
VSLVNAPARLAGRARAAALVLFAVGPLALATVHASTGIHYTARDGAYDDTTTGAVAHPEVAFGVGSGPMQTAIGLAKAHWGTNPCGGNVTIVWSQLDPSINAQSAWTNPRSAYDNPDLNTDCTVTFNPIADFDWPKFCTVTVHEYGHLSGKPHVNDSNDVMSPYYTKPVPECTANTPPQFQPTAPAPQVSAPAPTAAKAAKTTQVKVVKPAVVKKAAAKKAAPKKAKAKRTKVKKTKKAKARDRARLARRHARRTGKRRA